MEEYSEKITKTLLPSCLLEEIPFLEIMRSMNQLIIAQKSHIMEHDDLKSYALIVLRVLTQLNHL